MAELIVTAVCMGQDTGTVAKTRAPLVEVGQFGLSGDRHQGAFRKKKTGKLRGTVIFNEQQWSAVSEEEVRLLEERLGITIPVGALGENFRFTGMPGLTKLPRGTLLRFSSGVALAVAGENEPCRNAAHHLAAVSGLVSVQRKFVKAAYGLRGLVGWVEVPGVVAEGDRAAVEFLTEAERAGTAGD